MTKYPIKGSDSIVPTDPFVYRFYEIMLIYGLALKNVVQEKLGDGIMSAIDFTLDVSKEEDPIMRSRKNCYVRQVSSLQEMVIITT